MNNVIVFICLTLLWIGAIRGLKKHNLNFFSFLVGSIGLFTLLMLFFITPLEYIMGQVLSNIFEIIGGWTNWYEVYPAQANITIQTYNGIVSMMLTYECSAVIEILVYVALVAFFPFRSIIKRLGAGIVGVLYIMGINLVRILFIILSVKIGGIYSYEIAHVIVGRVLFFALMLLLYYYVFTRAQIKKQGVGGIR